MTLFSVTKLLCLMFIVLISSESTSADDEYEVLRGGSFLNQLLDAVIAFARIGSEPPANATLDEVKDETTDKLLELANIIGPLPSHLKQQRATLGSKDELVQLTDEFLDSPNRQTADALVDKLYVYSKMASPYVNEPILKGIVRDGSKSPVVKLFTEKKIPQIESDVDEVITLDDDRREDGSVIEPKRTEPRSYNLEESEDIENRPLNKRSKRSPPLYSNGNPRLPYYPSHNRPSLNYQGYYPNNRPSYSNKRYYNKRGNSIINRRNNLGKFSHGNKNSNSNDYYHKY